MGGVKEDVIILSSWGRVAYDYYREIPKHFPMVELDQFVIMPNHIHGIIIIRDDKTSSEESDVGALHAAPYPSTVKNSSLGIVIRSYKSSVTRKINRLRKTPGGRIWQRNYYDHIVRNEKEYVYICEYIRFNPQKWSEDRYFQAN